MNDSKVGVADEGCYKTFNGSKVNFIKNQILVFFSRNQRTKVYISYFFGNSLLRQFNMTYDKLWFFGFY